MKLALPSFAPLAALRHRTTTWWLGLSRREQSLVAILAALFLLWFGVSFIVRPLWAAHDRAMIQIHSYEDLRDRLRHAGSLGGVSVAQRAGSPTTILSASAAELGLAPTVTPDGERFRVVIPDAPYDSVIGWIANVEQSSNLRFVAMRIERGPATGMVSAEFTVRE